MQKNNTYTPLPNPPPQGGREIKTIIRQHALSLGFDAVGFTTPEVSPQAAEGLQEYIKREYHGDMGWLADKADRRADPKTLWPEAKSVVVLGHNYAPAADPMEKLRDTRTGNISCYAHGQDYHDVIKKKLRELAAWVAKEFSCEVKLFVDTAPVMEKTLAAKAGLGWQGKHTCLVSREFGSWLFLGSIFTTLDISLPHRGRAGVGALDERSSDKSPPPNLPPTGGGIGHCGTCTRCLDACPTNAFVGEGQIDARRCIAYLTNEHKGQIPIELRKSIGNRIYGCDDCLAVCPWNKYAKTSQESAYHAKEQLKAPPLRELARLDDAAFRALFSKSPVKRIGRDRFVRNVLVAIGNSGDTALREAAAPLIHDASPLVSEMAAWAIEELQKTPI